MELSPAVEHKLRARESASLLDTLKKAECCDAMDNPRAGSGSLIVVDYKMPVLEKVERRNNNPQYLAAIRGAVDTYNAMTGVITAQLKAIPGLQVMGHTDQAVIRGTGAQVAAALSLDLIESAHFLDREVGKNDPYFDAVAARFEEMLNPPARVEAKPFLVRSGTAQSFHAR